MASEHRFWRKFYSFIPGLLLCYFLPSLLRVFHIVDPEESNLYFVASRYLLPTSLVFLTLSTDFAGVLSLGPKAIVMFLTGTLGVVAGGPLVLFAFGMIHPEAVDEGVWRGMTTVAGSWIGGGANQAAMKEIFNVGDDVFSVLIAVDVLIANVWMGCLLIMAARSEAIDRFNGADASAIVRLRDQVVEFQKSVMKIPRLADSMILLAVGFGATGIAHLAADFIVPWIETNAPGLARLSLTSSFFWIVVTATTIGLGLSFTRARRLEGTGASRLGSVFIYVLVGTIGMNMDILAIADPRYRWLFAVGGAWMCLHAALMIVVARLIRAPVFLMAVGSQANIGGAASAPVVASAFHPSLAPVGVLLAVVGYALGTYAAWLCGLLLESAAPG